MSSVHFPCRITPSPLKLNKLPHNSFLDTLVSMPLSLQVMDVVNKLISSPSTAPFLPEGFANLYIANICQQCATAAGDKQNQARLVRLVCIFLQSLLRNNLIPITNEFEIEVESFCLQFVWVKEASDLFRIVKSWNNIC
ncbi:hypothetical protein BDR26DRAFT_168381 [Obelidium mucronatum]|nr:hypothetical protein BDR26DRAFT_168381 [Obelidium mucronatum]